MEVVQSSSAGTTLLKHGGTLCDIPVGGGASTRAGSSPVTRRRQQAAQGRVCLVRGGMTPGPSPFPFLSDGWRGRVGRGDIAGGLDIG